MGRGGRTKDRDNGPTRKCIATGETGPTELMIRFVVGPDNGIVADVLGKLPGRGIWVTSTKDALELAVKKGLFARAAKQAVTVPDDLVDRVEAQLAQRLIGLIALARKSGEAVAGYEKVKSWLSQDVAEILIQSSDGSERGKSKLSTPQHGSFIGWLTADELGLAFGRQTTIHAALGAGGLAPRVVEEAARLKGLRVSGGDLTARKEKRRTT